MQQIPEALFINPSTSHEEFDDEQMKLDELFNHLAQTEPEV